jgi:hypothetical protein
LRAGWLAKNIASRTRFSVTLAARFQALERLLLACRAVVVLLTTSSKEARTP